MQSDANGVIEPEGMHQRSIVAQPDPRPFSPHPSKKKEEEETHLAYDDGAK